MECNKDEAVRAKEMALNKMQSNDFEGGRKMAMKAQLLFPDLENITQLLAVCNVHCSAQSRILGTEKDWYGILQLERKVDEVTIKKQYRKLALVLHPDKNQFPGAEAAFKLIGEAHLVLSDSSKKAVYDSKIGALSKSAQLKHPPNIPPTWGKNGVHKSMANGYFNQFTVQKNPNATQYNANGMQQRFWTYCPFCNINYQYHRDFVKMKVTCQNCKKAFIAFDTGVQPGSNMTRPVPQAVPQAVPVPPRSTYQSQTASQGVPSGFYNRPQASNVGKPYNLSNQNQDVSHGFPAAAKSNQSSVSQATYKTAEKTTGFQPPQSGCPSNLGGTSSRDSRPNEDAVHQKKPVEKNKRKRKSVLDAEPSESVDTASSSDLEEVIADTAAAQKFGYYKPRRSSRQKQNVSYVEPQGDDDDFECPPQWSQVGKSFRGSEVGQEAADSLNKGSHASKGRSPEENAPSGESEIGGRPTDELNGGAQGVETIHDSDSDSESCSDDDASSNKFDCPDTEFHNFDKLREEICFSVDQFWACYGDSDGMPRFYAQVKNVCSNPFKVRISWLEFNPDDDSLASDWHESGLPVGCGIYKRGTRSILDPFTFSHPIKCANGKRKGSFVIYPRRGEIWALFRGWDAGWVNKFTRPKKYTYDIVEVLSDFTEDGGIQVTLLEKVKGFLSLFHRNNSDRTISLPPNEMLRFSHMIPFFKMKGDEKEGVPVGSFELDTASVNLEHDADPKDPSDSEMPKTTFKKTDELLSGKVSQISSSSPSIQKEASGTNSKISCGDSSASKSEFISEEINAQSPRRSRRVNLASSPRSHGPHDLFCDFSSGRSIENFKVGQLWALYNSESKLPKIYAKIKKIQLSPSKLHVALLETCLGPENDSSACGTFKVQKGTQNFEPTYFSHLLDVKPSKKDTFEIYPEKGQIWALNKNQLLSSDPRKCDYDIVEIISKCKGLIKVLFLVKLKDYKSVFSSSDGTLEIQVKDVARFSHQIPAVKLTNEGGRCWTGGCWELDPASVPLNK